MKSVKILSSMVCILTISIPLSGCDSMRDTFGYPNEPSQQYSRATYSNTVVTTTERNPESQNHKKTEGVTMVQPGVSTASTPQPSSLGKKSAVPSEAPMVTGPAPTIGQ